jgi:hypothetical protein
MTSTPIRNRIKGHRRIRAGDLVLHEWNYRAHPDMQRAALLTLYQEVGFARSLLAYELPDNWLKLLEGYLRRDLDTNMEVDVEIRDVTDEEARALLLSLKRGLRWRFMVVGSTARLPAVVAHKQFMVG